MIFILIKSRNEIIASANNNKITVADFAIKKIANKFKMIVKNPKPLIKLFFLSSKEIFWILLKISHERKNKIIPKNVGSAARLVTPLSIEVRFGDAQSKNLILFNCIIA